MNRVFLTTGLVATLGACTMQAPITIEQPPASAAVVSTMNSDRLANGTTTIAVRSYVKDDKGRHTREITGIPCKIDSDELRASVVTPQEVIVPNFKQRAEMANRGLPSALIIACESDDLRGVASVQSQEKKLTTTTGGGIAAALIVTAVSAVAASTTPWVYPEAVAVPMNPK